MDGLFDLAEKVWGVRTHQTTPERLEQLPLWEKLTAEAAKLTLAEEVAKELTESEDQESAAGKEKSTTEIDPYHLK